MLVHWVLVKTRHDHLTTLVAALEAIEAAAGDNAERSLEIQARARSLRSSLDAGEPLVDLVRGEPRPSTAELLLTNMATLETAPARRSASSPRDAPPETPPTGPNGPRPAQSDSLSSAAHPSSQSPFGAGDVVFRENPVALLGFDTEVLRPPPASSGCCPRRRPGT